MHQLEDRCHNSMYYYVYIVSKSEYHGSHVIFLGVLSNHVVTGDFRFGANVFDYGVLPSIFTTGEDVSPFYTLIWNPLVLGFMRVGAIYSLLLALYILKVSTFLDHHDTMYAPIRE